MFYFLKIESNKNVSNFAVYIRRVLHYPFNWIRFLEINKLCNAIAKNLTFSTNRKLISISWKVWTCSNFSTNWKWKWMNRIRHGKKKAVEKQKFELIWESLWNILSDNYKIRQEEGKSVGSMSEKLKWQVINHFFKNIYLNPRSLNERYGGLKGIFRTPSNIYDGAFCKNS